MRLSASEKMEIIRVVEESELSVRRTLAEIGIHRSTFYKWYHRYRAEGVNGLKRRNTLPKTFWNRIPESVKQKVVNTALEHTDKSPRELACVITDIQGYFISESSVYRILKSYDLVTSPSYVLMSASDTFRHPTSCVNELWQTDFTYFRVVGWGWYFLSTILDDYSRYIITWKLFKTMAADDEKETLDEAIKATGVEHVKVKQRPRLLSDNGPCYVSDELKKYLKGKGMEHTRGAPYHPQTQGKIERYHRSMKNVVKLEHYYFPWELEKAIGQFVEHYNHHRYHESLNNVTPADVFFGRDQEVLERRNKIKQQTMLQRRGDYRKFRVA